MPFPSVLSSFPRPNPTDRLNSPSHSSLHNSVSSALGQVEAVIGVEGASSVVGTLEYLIKSPASNGGGHVQSPTTGGTGLTTFTKGDLIVGSGTNVLSRQSVGTDATVLTADSTQSNGVRWGSSSRFGGTGADGALVISSGTTTLNLASVVSAIKNYTSISITGTGKLAFSSPNSNGTVLVLKSQGGVTLTSSTAPHLDVSSLGGAGGAPQTNTDGVNGNNGSATLGVPATKGIANVTTTGGVAGTAPSVSANTTTLYRTVLFDTGAGGASGGSTNPTGLASGAGGFGGGALIIECAGALNFTTANGISVNGGTGGNGTNNGAGAGSAGGGGGGGGSALILYNTLTASSGTITVAGGAGGNGGTGTAGTGKGGGGGGGGASVVGVAGSNNSGSNGGAGGAGGVGYSLIVSNTEF